MSVRVQPIVRGHTRSRTARRCNVDGLDSRGTWPAGSTNSCALVGELKDAKMDSSHESSSPQAEVWERFGVTVFQALLILCVLLDIFVYFGVRLAHKTVASVTYTIRPFGVLATPFS